MQLRTSQKTNNDSFLILTRHENDIQLKSQLHDFSRLPANWGQRGRRHWAACFTLKACCTMKKLSTHSKSSIKELSSQQRLWLGLHKLTPPATGQEDRAPFTTTSTQVAAPTLEKSSCAPNAGNFFSLPLTTFYWWQPTFTFPPILPASSLVYRAEKVACESDELTGHSGNWPQLCCTLVQSLRVIRQMWERLFAHKAKMG